MKRKSERFNLIFSNVPETDVTVDIKELKDDESKILKLTDFWVLPEIKMSRT